MRPPIEYAFVGPEVIHGARQARDFDISASGRGTEKTLGGTNVCSKRRPAGRLKHNENTMQGQLMEDLGRWNYLAG